MDDSERGKRVMSELVFQIVFSLILLPVNLCCAFWIFEEALSLTGMTFREFLAAPPHPVFPSGSAGVRRRQRFLVRFFREHSREPEKSIRLLRAFGFCTLPGLAALILAEYAAISANPDKLAHVFIGNLALVLLNIALAFSGRIYRKKHPQDAQLAAKRAEEKQRGRKNRARNIVVYSLVGAFFFAVLLFFHLGMAGSFGARRAERAGHEKVSAVLAERGFETANMPTTYWFLDESKLMYVCAGAKGQSKFEFYEYTDGETTDGVYRAMVSDLSQDMEQQEREDCETVFSGGGRLFARKKDGVYHLVMVQGNSAVYAYAPESLEEINEILLQIGYLKER